MNENTSLPYVGSSGSSGSEASAERAADRDEKQITSRDQREARRLLAEQRGGGLTQAELQEEMGVGHGTASQVLSNLHAAGHVARLVERRKRSHVYVLPEHVDGRELSPYRRLQSRVSLRARIDALESALRDLLANPTDPQAASIADLTLADRLEDR
jgi:ribosomal protein S25